MSPAHDTPLRDRILQTALGLFSREGYFNTSMHDIRRAADVSTGAIYHYFTGKEALAEALYDELLDWLEREIAGLIRHHHSCHERCKAAVQRLFELTESHPEAMDFILHARHREFLREKPPICSASPFETLKQLVAEGMNRGEVRLMDTTLAAAMLFGGPIRMIHLRLDGVVTRPLTDQLEQCWPCAWRSVAG